MQNGEVIKMATFRMVHTEFWDDPKVIEEMTPEDKYFFLYLLTNPNTAQVGIYQITKKQMAFDMGYSMETINSLLDRFLNHHKLVRYNAETREIAIKNWGRYNLRRGGKPMLDCVNSELKDIKDQSLISYVGSSVENESIKKIYDTYSDTYHDTLTDTHSDTYHDTSEKQDPSSGKGSYDTSTIRGTCRPQYKEQEEEQDKEEDKEQQQEQEGVAKVIQFWDENGFGINNINAKESLLLWLDDSSFKNPSEMILKSLDIASKNDARRLNYVEGILRNWHNESILTLEEVEKNDIRLQKRRSSNTSGSGKGTSYEQAKQELEAAERALGRGM